MLNRKRNERSNTSHETSLIARGTTIRGHLRFNGTLHLDGHIKGTALGEGTMPSSRSASMARYMAISACRRR